MPTNKPGAVLLLAHRTPQSSLSHPSFSCDLSSSFLNVFYHQPSQSYVASAAARWPAVSDRETNPSKFSGSPSSMVGESSATTTAISTTGLGGGSEQSTTPERAAGSRKRFSLNRLRVHGCRPLFRFYADGPAQPLNSYVARSTLERDSIRTPQLDPGQTDQGAAVYSLFRQGAVSSSSVGRAR